MPSPVLPPRQVALANLIVPGSGYLLLERRVLFGGLVLAYTAVTVALAALYVSILYTHFAHVHPDGYPAIVAAVVLYVFQHATIAVGTAVDGYYEARRALPDDVGRVHGEAGGHVVSLVEKR